MGHPKKPKKQYKKPNHPYEKERMITELKLVGRYGLRNKRELWKAQTILGNLRSQARSILAEPEGVREIRERDLLARTHRLGILEDDATLDNVLGLSIESILDRRLQTVVYRLGYPYTPYQARQMIVQRHVMLGDEIVSTPSRLVKRHEEEKIGLSPFSKFADEDHPMRAKGEKAQEEEEQRSERRGAEKREGGRRGAEKQESEKQEATEVPQDKGTAEA